MLLALDTSTAAVTVAVADGDHVLAERTVVDARRHAELVAPAIVDVLDAAGVDRAELTEIVAGVGPGPFTGLRVGLVTALTLGASLGIPVRGVCSLDVIAAAVSGGEDGRQPDRFVVVTDARRREVYWAAYEGGRRVDGPVVSAPRDVATELPAAGIAARMYPEAFARPFGPEYPSAAVLAAAAVTGAIELRGPDPLYLRRPDARPPGERKSVLAR